MVHEGTRRHAQPNNGATLDYAKSDTSGGSVGKIRIGVSKPLHPVAGSRQDAASFAAPLCRLPAYWARLASSMTQQAQRTDMISICRYALATRIMAAPEISRRITQLGLIPFEHGVGCGHAGVHQVGPGEVGLHGPQAQSRSNTVNPVAQERCVLRPLRHG